MSLWIHKHNSNTNIKVMLRYGLTEFSVSEYRCQKRAPVLTKVNDYHVKHTPGKYATMSNMLQVSLFCLDRFRSRGSKWVHSLSYCSTSGKKGLWFVCCWFSVRWSSVQYWTQYFFYIPSAKSTTLEATATPKPRTAPPSNCFGATGFSASPWRLFLPNKRSQHWQHTFNRFLSCRFGPSRLAQHGPYWTSTQAWTWHTLGMTCSSSLLR